jgi:hypothetical protein
MLSIGCLLEVAADDRHPIARPGDRCGTQRFKIALVEGRADRLAPASCTMASTAAA